MISSSDLGVSQGSVLSPLLYNIYMTELDNFIESLKLKYTKTNSTSAADHSLKKEYEQFTRKFKTKKELANTLAELGSPKLVLALYKKERTALLKKHQTTGDDSQKLRRINYVRYANDFIIGITGSRDFALKIAAEIESFIKSDLHFHVHSVSLTSRDKGPVKFLDFNIYLSSIKHKAKIKNNKIKSIEQYKKKSLAHLKANDASISQAYLNSIKHGFLNYLQNAYEKLHLRKNKNTDMLLIKNFVNKNIEELCRINPQNGTKKPELNPTLRRYTQHFKELFSKNTEISLKARALKM